MEFTFAWLYVCGKGRLFGAIRSLCDRLEFACSQLERCCLDEVKNECQKKMTDCQALSQQLIGSLREARLIIMQYEEDDAKSAAVRTNKKRSVDADKRGAAAADSSLVGSLSVLSRTCRPDADRPPQLAATLCAF
uniref:Uncharacterized protein n=1 Tax=Plectus sambesii TaxID=2011161 RepID=A0A914X7D1_9BILA